MRTKREEIPVKPCVVAGPTYCDVCGKDVAANTSKFERNDVSIDARIGEIWDDGHSARVVYEADICKRCFLDTVLPALRNAGVKVRERMEGVDGRVWEHEVGSTPAAEDPDPLF